MATKRQIKELSESIREMVHDKGIHIDRASEDMLVEKLTNTTVRAISGKICCLEKVFDNEKENILHIAEQARIAETQSS